MKELDEVLLHFGKKGMKWGQRKSKSSKGQNGSKKSKEPGTIKKEWDSLKRERQWNRVLENAHKMSTKDINKTVSRIRMENDLKQLSRKNVGSSKDKQDYINRAKMSDQVIARKVNRLRAKDNLDRTIREATKGQREFGKQVVSEVAKIMKTINEASQT